MPPRTVVLRFAYSGSSSFGVGVWSVEDGGERRFDALLSFSPPAGDVQVGYLTLLQALLRLRSAYPKGSVAVRAVFPERCIPSQLSGEWRVRDPSLRRLWESVKELEGQFAGVEYVYSPEDTADERADLRERMGEGEEIFLTPEMARSLRERLPSVLRALRGLTLEQSFFLLKLLQLMLPSAGLKVSRKELLKGRELVAGAVEELSRLEAEGEKEAGGIYA